MSRTLTKHDDPGMVEVRREDQMNINKFSALNRKLQEIAAEDETNKKDLQDLQDAADEMLLADDDELVKCAPPPRPAPPPPLPIPCRHGARFLRPFPCRC